MPRILVVDDEPRIVSFVSRALTAEGFAVESALDGRRGSDLARSGRFELVVLDLLLPGLHGVAVLREILEARPQQRVLVLSAVSDVESRVDCLELGATDFMTKPFALSELVARIRARLRQPPAEAPGRFLIVGHVRLDVIRRVADSGAGWVALSEREFLLLQHLMLKEGEACSRQRLLEDVWGYSFDPGSNVVDVAVGRIRSKLGPEVIETVRNVGYRFNGP
ncbi:MAG TPA: response regulator transcription factor [Actinomycetota bacterium]